MNFETLEFKREGNIGILTINRPKALNALNAQVIQDLKSFLTQVKSEKGLRALILTGSGEKAFVAGADIKEMESISAADAKQFSENGQIVFQEIEDLPIPTIAAVNGFALGGGLELAMACDFIVATKTAKLGLPEVSLGLIPGYGGTQRLARYCGKGVARMMTLTGDVFTADQCAIWGLVTMVTDPTELIPTCLKLAASISKRSPLGVALAKKSINQGYDLDQTAGMSLEAKLFAEVFASADKKEGVAAFLEKRAPNFND
ncbi:MAG: enoyl-CoA hydratase/isomerase family protein [Bdellovibrionales bacterium]|nr:enoyl-CoA hydratase/isomerase family protein [Bdellovibrionales bacterium]